MNNNLDRDGACSGMGQEVASTELPVTLPSDKAHEAIHEAAELIANCYCSEEDVFQNEVCRLVKEISNAVDSRRTASAGATKTLYTEFSEWWDSLGETIPRTSKEVAELAYVQGRADQSQLFAVGADSLFTAAVERIAAIDEYHTNPAATSKRCGEADDQLRLAIASYRPRRFPFRRSRDSS